MRADSHSPDCNFSLQNPPQLYDLQHDVIPPQTTDSQNPHPPSTRTQNDFQTLLKKPSSSTKQSGCFSLIYPTNRGVETGQVLTEVSLEDVDLLERSCELRL